MKTITTWALILWLGLTLEHAHPKMFPSASLILPLAVSCLSWCRHSPASVLLAGGAMTACWTLTPAGPPLGIITVLLLSMWLTTHQKPNAGWSSQATGLAHHRWWVDPLVVTAAGIVARATAAADLTPAVVYSEFSLRLIVALPCLTLAALVARSADELGLRHQHTPV